MEFQAALALNPRLDQARYQLAVCWFALGRTRETRQEFERLEKESGIEANGEYQLAQLDLREGAMDSAIRRLTGLVNNPPFPGTSYYLGIAQLQKGNLV